MMGDEGHFFHGGGFMWVFWVLIIVEIFFLFQNMAKGNFEKRYARGDIDEEKFERRRKELNS